MRALGRSIMFRPLCFLLRSFQFLHGNNVLPSELCIQRMHSFDELRGQI